MKRYTFALNNNFRNDTTTIKDTNWSKILDNLIADNLKSNNKYINTHSACINCPLRNSSACSSNLKDNDFIKAALFLANYKKNRNNIKCEIGKTYRIGSTPIIFYDDEIQIGFDIFSYDDLRKKYIIDTFGEDTRKAIINIYNIYINF